MTRTLPAILAFITLLGSSARAVIPATALYPFPGYDLEALRIKTKAESIPESTELTQAWTLYRMVQGSWEPKAPKPEEATVAELDKLKEALESLKKPRWFTDALKSPASGQTDLAEKVGDAPFEAQRATPEYQSLKALTIIYLAEHELDREGAAQKAGRYLMVLSATHPWDWQVHGLNSRLLVDARMTMPAWETAKVSLFLNPDPSIADLNFFAFIGALADKDNWPEIQEAMRQAVTDKSRAQEAIEQSEKLYLSGTTINVVTPHPR